MSQLVPRPSLAERTAEVLRSGIRTGLWHDRLPGERVLSEELGVSRPTLRDALAIIEQEGRLTTATGVRRRIRQRAGQTQARPRSIALLTGVPLREVQPFALAWIERLHDLLEGAGLRFEVQADRHWTTTRPERDLARCVRERPADTWLLLLSSLPMQQWFARHRISCLLAGSPHAGVDLPAIDVDNRAVCRHAAGQLLARGHRRIALVLPCPIPAGDEASRLGFEEAIGAHRGSAVTSLLVSHDGTLAGIRRALARTMRLTQRPTGFIVARPLNVLAVATELSRLGFKPGQDVALISRDSDHFLEYLSPVVARYAITPDAFARRLSRMLLAMIGGGAPAVRQVRLVPQSVAGESLCDAPPF